jgi:hypothetical protein
VTCIDPHAKDQVANYKCTCIVCKSTDQSALDCDGGGGESDRVKRGKREKSQAGKGCKERKTRWKISPFCLLPH